MGNEFSKILLISFFGLYYGTFAICVVYTAYIEGWCLCGHLKRAFEHLYQCLSETNRSTVSTISSTACSRIIMCIKCPFTFCIKFCIRRRRNVVGYDPVGQSIV
jgi:hypothetical protein